MLLGLPWWETKAAAGEIARPGKDLPHKHENLSLNPSHCVKSQMWELLQSQCRGGGDLRTPRAHWLAGLTKQEASVPSGGHCLRNPRQMVPGKEWCLGQFCDLHRGAHTKMKIPWRSHIQPECISSSLLFFFYGPVTKQCPGLHKSILMGLSSIVENVWAFHSCLRVFFSFSWSSSTGRSLSCLSWSIFLSLPKPKGIAVLLWHFLVPNTQINQRHYLSILWEQRTSKKF